MGRFRLVLALVILGPAPVRAEDSKPGDWTAPEVTEFGDWSVACDNARECTAVSVSRSYVKRMESSDAGDYAMPKLWVKRRAGPSQPPRVFVDTSVWGEARPIGALTLHVYYECDGDCTGRAYKLKQIEAGRYELAPEQVAAFFAESIKTNRAATRFGNGEMHGVLTTGGMTAAMRFIDESQQRRGTVTAIYAKGAQPAKAVPPEKMRVGVKIVRGLEEPVSASPNLAALERKRTEFCEKPGNTSFDPPIVGIRLTNGQRLWAIGCGSNPHYEKRLWLIENREGGLEVHKMPRPEQGRPAELPILPNSNFDPGSGQITSYSSGMCGWRRRWAWTGTAFEMVDSIEMPTCIDILPHQWLQTYRAIPQ
jgi:Protein of unknown function (DUF1176)